MKKILRFIILAALFSAPFAYSEPASQEGVKQLMKITGAANLSVQMINQILPALKKAYPNTSEQFWTEFASSINPADFENMVIPIYQKYLSQEDIAALINFYSTPAGKKLIQLQPQIMSESVAAGQEWGRKLALEADRRYKAKNAAN